MVAFASLSCLCYNSHGGDHVNFDDFCELANRVDRQMLRNSQFLKNLVDALPSAQTLTPEQREAVVDIAACVARQTVLAFLEEMQGGQTSDQP